MKRTEPTAAELLAGIAADLSRLADIYSRTLAGLEERLAAAEKKSRDLRSRAPIREINSRLQTAEFKIFRLQRQIEGRPAPAPEGAP